MYSLPGLEKFPELVSGVSMADEGNMSQRWGDSESVRKNKRNFLRKLNIKPEDCVAVSLLLGTKIRIVGEKNKGKLVKGDALITAKPGVGLWMLTADCYAVVVYDAKKKILGLVHLGRQGADGGLAEKVVGRFKDLGSKPEDLVVSAGPGIRQKSYVWEGKLPFKKDWGGFAVQSEVNKWQINIGGFLCSHFINNGIREQNIRISEVDVFNDPRFFSHVRSVKTGEPEARFATVVMMRSK